MNYLALIVCYIQVKFDRCIDYLIPYSNILIYEKSTHKIYNFKYLYYVFYTLLKLLNFFVRCLRFEIIINNKMKHYNVVYQFNEKIYLSDKFIINGPKEKEEIRGQIIDDVQICLNNNMEINITNIIKKYSNNFPILLFLITNNYNPILVKYFSIKYFDLTKGMNIKKKNANEYLEKSIYDLFNL
ncbi:hypothetical protein CPAV1605_708 [seawater metagenome]|uniref:Uncharacterized protein n=1 Tax=seawater metagenome TaxID=1561972 RepID=A0A5E8CHY6_9ZZZZ